MTDVRNIETVREWLEMELDLIGREPPQGLFYRSPQDFVVREGREYEPRPYDAERWGPKGPQRECFSNALALALRYPDELTYVEGYAFGVLVCFHAWCTSEGEAVDSTWPEPGRGYLGVEFPLDFVLETVTSKGTSGVIDNYEQHYPLLRERWEG